MYIKPDVPYISDDDLEARALDLLSRYSQAIEPFTQLPVPVERIADLYLQLTIDWSPIPDSDGDPILALIDPKRRILRLNEARRHHFDQYFGTLQFSIAHELGHHELHLSDAVQLSLPGADNGPVCLCRQRRTQRTTRLGSNERRELQAERFGSFLLLPRELLLQRIEGVDVCNLSVLRSLRLELGVSLSALRYRLEGLGRLYVGRDHKFYPSKAAAIGQQSLF